jgi:hypothetical protein
LKNTNRSELTTKVVDYHVKDNKHTNTQTETKQDTNQNRQIHLNKSGVREGAPQRKVPIQETTKTQKRDVQQQIWKGEGKDHNGRKVVVEHNVREIGAEKSEVQRKIQRPQEWRRGTKTTPNSDQLYERQIDINENEAKREKEKRKTSEEERTDLTPNETELDTPVNTEKRPLKERKDKLKKEKKWNKRLLRWKKRWKRWKWRQSKCQVVQQMERPIQILVKLILFQSK